MKWLSEALDRMQRDLAGLIPRRKQVALDEMATVLADTDRQAAATADGTVIEPLR